MVNVRNQIEQARQKLQRLQQKGEKAKTLSGKTFKAIYPNTKQATFRVAGAEVTTKGKIRLLLEDGGKKYRYSLREPKLLVEIGDNWGADTDNWTGKSLTLTLNEIPRPPKGGKPRPPILRLTGSIAK